MSVQGRVLQLSVSREGGVPKRPVPEARLTREGVRGDGHAHPRIHGGPDAAVLMIDDAWLAHLVDAGFRVFPGALGENVTSTGVDAKWLAPGTRVQVGNAVIEVVKARVPCRTIDVYGAGIAKHIYDARSKSGDVASPVWGASGLLFRVITEGDVRAGDAIVVRVP